MSNTKASTNPNQPIQEMPIAQPQPNELAQLIEQTVEQALAAFQDRQRAQPEPNELAQERKKRENLERRVNELIEEGRRARESAEQAERYASIKSELQQLGVTKVDLA